jgi:hypothetical protein
MLCTDLSIYHYQMTLIGAEIVNNFLLLQQFLTAILHRGLRNDFFFLRHTFFTYSFFLNF